MHWRLRNSVLIPSYGLQTFFVSLEGVLSATFVLIKQSRTAVQSDQREHLNLQVHLLPEEEMTLALRILGHISNGWV